MNIIEKPLSELKPYKNNAKIHTDAQIEQIARSIEITKGLRQPIVIDENNVIVAGHGRYLAACRLGLKTVPCELVNDLTEDEIKAYRLIDNKVAQGDYDFDIAFDELNSIDMDLSEFGFEYDGVNDFEELGEDEESYDDGLRDHLHHNVFENQERMQFFETNYYGIPEVAATQTVGDKFLRFRDWKTIDDYSEHIAHFYYDDYKFIAAWRDPDKYVERLKKFKAVISPDFSLYTDFPRALQILSCYRRNWCGAYWQSLGIDVIPDVVWGDAESFNYCFEGLPKRSTVAVSSVGVKRDKEWNGETADMFKAGWDEMINRIEPTTILYYGDMIDGLEGKIIRIPSFYEQKREYLNQKARAKK